MSALTESSFVAQAMLDGVVRVAPRSVERHAFQAVVNAIRLADIVCGAWGPVDDGYEPAGDMHASDIADDLQRDRHPATCPTDEEWHAATIERSRVNRDYLRIHVGHRVWIVEESTDCGYGDDGSGCRRFYNIEVEGERATSEVKPC